MKFPRYALPMLWIATAPAVWAQATGCCTHQGGSVACPSGLPPGSGSVQFVREGTQWRTPDGKLVFVPATSFASCTRPPPQPIAQPPAPTPTKPSPAPPPATAPPVAATPGAAPPPADGPRPPEPSTRERPRTGPVVRMPSSPPVIVAPSPAAPVEEGKDADAAIGRMGRLLQQQEAQPKQAAGIESCGPPGAGGNRVAIASGVCPDCSGPPVLRQEGPGAPPVAPASIVADVSAQVRWFDMERPFRRVVGGKSGLVSGETKYVSTIEIQGRCAITAAGCRGDCVRMAFERVSAKVVVEIRYVRGQREHAAHEATHARQIRDVVQQALQGLTASVDVFSCRKRTAAEQQQAACEARLASLAQAAADQAHASWKQERNRRYALPNGYRDDPAEQEAFAAGEDKAAEIAARERLTDEQRNAARNAELTFPAGINPPVEFGGEAPAPTRRR